jgi:hypothetical protein
MELENIILSEVSQVQKDHLILNLANWVININFYVGCKIGFIHLPALL